MLILILQFCLIIGFAGLFYSYVQNSVKPVKVYVFSRDLTPNTKITETDIKSVDVPAKAVTDDFALNAKDIIGKYVGTKVYENQFVYKKQLLKKGQTDPFDSMDLSKLRKISLPISYVEGFGGNLKRGDRVDLVFTGVGKKATANGEQEFQYSKVFLQDVYVYNVTTGDGYKFVDRSNQTPGAGDGKEISTSANTGEMAVVTLAVTLDQAEEITARMNAGKIRLLARFNDSQSYETLGFVLGDYQKVFSAPANAETSKSSVN